MRRNVRGARYRLVQINLREDNPEPKRILQMIARGEAGRHHFCEEASVQWTKWLTILQAPIPTISLVLMIPTHMGRGHPFEAAFSEDAQTACVGDGLFPQLRRSISAERLCMSQHCTFHGPGRQPYQLRYIEPELLKERPSGRRR